MKKDSSKKKDTTIHDLNNLLTSISLSTEMLLKKFCGPLNPKQKEYLKGILVDSKKMKKTIKKISD